MPREKLPGSKRTFGNLNLEPHQEKYLKKFLKNKGISLDSFTRSLYRGWLKTNEIGVSDLTDDV